MMVLSPSEQDDLVRRVERLVKHRGIDRTVIARAVDRVLGTLGTASVEQEIVTHTVVVMAESMPDLASRLRSVVQQQATLRDAAVASEGRHTVLTARVLASEVAAVRQAADGLGVRFVVRENVA
jgi:hypothetical protein